MCDVWATTYAFLGMKLIITSVIRNYPESNLMSHPWDSNVSIRHLFSKVSRFNRKHQFKIQGMYLTILLFDKDPYNTVSKNDQFSTVNIKGVDSK